VNSNTGFAIVALLVLVYAFCHGAAIRSLLQSPGLIMIQAIACSTVCA